MATKDKRFQLFLFGLHDKVGNSAGKNGVSLSTEVRNRVSRSYWQDEVIDALFKLNADEFTLTDLKELARDVRTKHNHEMQKLDADYAAWKASQ